MGDAQNVLMALWPGKQRQTCRGVTSVHNSVLSPVNGADIAGGPALWQELFLVRPFAGGFLRLSAA